MHPFKTLGLLGLSPLAHCSLNACRPPPAIAYQQCAAQWIDFRYSARGQFGIQSSRSAHNSAASPSIAYRVGAAFSAKDRRFNTKQDLFSFDPKRQASEKQPFTGRPASGQDAFFISSVGNGSSTAFGVADGVGGWLDSGIDSAHFSHGLCRYLTKNAKGNDESKELTARELLSQGYVDVVADKAISGGGTTACVAVGHADGLLQVAK